MQKVPHTAQVFEDGEAGDRARALVGQSLSDGLRKEWFSKNMHLGNCYTGSPVCVYDEPEAPEQIEAKFLDAVNCRPGTRPGARAPHTWLADGRSTVDLFGRGFVLMPLQSRASMRRSSVHWRAYRPAQTRCSPRPRTTCRPIAASSMQWA